MIRLAKIVVPASALLLLALAGGNAAAGAGQEAGVKTIHNNSAVSMTVTLAARDSSKHCCISLPAITAVIAAGQSATIAYGSNANPFLNELDIEVTSPKGTDINLDYLTTGAGKLNNLFNLNSTIIIGFKQATFGFTLVGAN